MNISAIITAAGFGHRFGEKKQFKLLNKKPLYQYSLNVFLQSDMIDEIILVVPIENKKVIKQDLRKFSQKKIKVISGGTSRIDSVKKGVISSSNSELVVIHDAARPFVSNNIIYNCIDNLNDNIAICPALPCTDTIAEVKNNKAISKALNRNVLYKLQTPQAFNYKILFDCHKKLDEQVTDDISIIKKQGYNCKIIDGDIKNMKITYKEDFKILESLI